MIYWTQAPQIELHKDNSSGGQWFWTLKVYNVSFSGLCVFRQTSTRASRHRARSSVLSNTIRMGPCLQKKQSITLWGSITTESRVLFVRFTDGNQIWVAELETDSKTIRVNTLRLCFGAAGGWEDESAKVNEGPFCINHNGYYYLSYSANDYLIQSYGIGDAISNSHLGTWTKTRLTRYYEIQSVCMEHGTIASSLTGRTTSK
jgi:hypothetical protein